MSQSKKPFEIVFNDEYVIVLDKIVKLLIQPTGKKDEHTLTNVLERVMGERVFPCHRLDRETTGLIMYAKTRRLQTALMDEFRARRVVKKYYALVRGVMPKKRGVLRGHIIDQAGLRHGEKRRPAHTEYRLLRAGTDYSVVELMPLTGRTNQLRIQLARIGHPILGERQYAYGRDFPVKFKRLALHAFFLSFIHPVSGERVTLTIDMARDMKEFLGHNRVVLPG